MNISTLEMTNVILENLNVPSSSHEPTPIVIFRNKAILRDVVASHCSGSVLFREGSSKTAQVGIFNSTFTNNTASYGSMLFSDSDTGLSVTLANTSCTNNIARARGSLIYSRVKPSLTLTGNDFVSNSDSCGTALFATKPANFRWLSDNSSLPLEQDLQFTFGFYDEFDNLACNSESLPVYIYLDGLHNKSTINTTGITSLVVSWKNLPKFPNRVYSPSISLEDKLAPQTFRTSKNCGRFITRVYFFCASDL